MNQQKQSAISDSPWFWLHLFATFALIGLMVIQSKYVQRQAGIERKGHSRRVAPERVNHRADQVHTAAAGRNDSANRSALQTVSLRPLMILLALATVGGWIAFWYQRRKPHSTFPENGTPHGDSA